MCVSQTQSAARQNLFPWIFLRWRWKPINKNYTVRCNRTFSLVYIDTQYLSDRFSHFAFVFFFLRRRYVANSTTGCFCFTSFLRQFCHSNFNNNNMDEKRHVQRVVQNIIDWNVTGGTNHTEWISFDSLVLFFFGYLFYSFVSYWIFIWPQLGKKKKEKKNRPAMLITNDKWQLNWICTFQYRKSMLMSIMDFFLSFFGFYFSHHFFVGNFLVVIYPA